MRYHELYADEAGESRWRDVEVALEERSFAPPAKAIEVSEAAGAARMLFLRLHAGWDEPVHPTPVPQVLVCLSGRVRVTASDGAAREIGQGDVWRMADTHGKGHRTEVLGAGDFHAVIVQEA